MNKQQSALVGLYTGLTEEQVLSYFEYVATSPAVYKIFLSVRSLNMFHEYLDKFNMTSTGTVMTLPAACAQFPMFVQDFLRTGFVSDMLLIDDFLYSAKPFMEFESKFVIPLERECSGIMLAIHSAVHVKTLIQSSVAMYMPAWLYSKYAHEEEELHIQEPLFYNNALCSTKAYNAEMASVSTCFPVSLPIDLSVIMDRAEFVCDRCNKRNLQRVYSRTSPGGKAVYVVSVYEHLLEEKYHSSAYVLCQGITDAYASDVLHTLFGKDIPLAISLDFLNAVVSCNSLLLLGVTDKPVKRLTAEFGIYASILLDMHKPIMTWGEMDDLFRDCKPVTPDIVTKWNKLYKAVQDEYIHVVFDEHSQRKSQKLLDYVSIPDLVRLMESGAVTRRFTFELEALTLYPLSQYLKLDALYKIEDMYNRDLRRILKRIRREGDYNLAEWVEWLYTTKQHCRDWRINTYLCTEVNENHKPSNFYTMSLIQLQTDCEKEVEIRERYLSED